MTCWGSEAQRMQGALACITTLAACWVPQIVVAAENRGPAPSCELDLNVQPLGGALAEIGRRCGQQVIFLSYLTEGKNAPRLRGNYTIETALDEALAGTGLSFHRINAATLDIRRAPPETKAVTPAAADRPPAPASPSLPQVVIRSAVESLVAARTETPLREIPQTMAVISSEQMRQQNSTSLADALTDAVGITALQHDSANQTFFSRGFLVTTYHVDGGGSLHTLSYDPNFINEPLFMSPDLSEFERIEVLRGADGLFGAGGNPGATVNLVRKRPQPTFAIQTSVLAGSWNHYRAEADITGPLAWSGALRARFAAAHEYTGYFYDKANLNRKNLFAALEYDLSPLSLIVVGGSYAWLHAHPFELGLPAFPDGNDAHLPRRTSYVFNWQVLHSQMREGYLRFEHHFTPSWRLQVNATLLNGSSQYDLGHFDGPLNPVTYGLNDSPRANYSRGPVTQQQISTEATITGSMHLFGMLQELAFGGDFSHLYGKQTSSNVLNVGPPLANALNFDPAVYPDPQANPLNQYASIFSTSTVQSGYFASLRATRQPWQITLGLRFSNDQSTQSVGALYFGQTFALGSPFRFSNIGKTTPYLGLMYSLNPNISLYTSYADIYLPNTYHRLPDGGPVHPADGINMEAGVKGEWREGALNGTLAVYRTVQRGLASYYSLKLFPGAAQGCCYLPDGEVKAKGVDLELSGMPLSGIQLNAGYTFNNNISLIPAYFYGQATSETPRHLLKVWSDWRLPGGLRRWSLGATLESRSGFSVVSLSCNVDATGNCVGGLRPAWSRQGFFAIINPRVGFEVSRNWRAALTIKNLFDRVYYETVGGPSYGNWYGQPRSFQFRVDAHFD